MCIRFIPNVILRNFVRNYANQEDFPLNGLKTLLRILQRSDADGQVLKVVMVHLSKASVSVAGASVHSSRKIGGPTGVEQTNIELESIS